MFNVALIFNIASVSMNDESEKKMYNLKKD